jgi:sec-independent protein translocase protein TatC
MALLPKPASDAAEHDRRVDEEGQPFLSHLLELRARILRGVLAVLLLFFPIYYFANEIYAFVAAPLMSNLPEGASMIATAVASPFLTPFKLALYVSLLAAMPVVLHQAWAFVSPGLYLREKRFAFPLLVSSILLFYLGMAFAYFVVFPLVFRFFASVTPVGITMMTDINAYLDFVISMFFAFGLSFEVPIAVFLLVASGLTSTRALTAKRPYIIVGCFVVGMFLTPPDVISQSLLAVPMWALFELGVLFARLAEKAEAGAAEEGSGTGQTPGGV